MSELIESAKAVISAWDDQQCSIAAMPIEQLRAAVEKAESSHPVQLSDEEIENLFEENPIGKYPRITIARAIEKAVLEKNKCTN